MFEKQEMREESIELSEMTTCGERICMNNPSAQSSDLCLSLETSFVLTRNLLIFITLALDPFKPVKNENQFINLTEDNIAIIPCELPNGNPRPSPIFYLNDEPINIASYSGM